MCWYYVEGRGINMNVRVVFLILLLLTLGGCSTLSAGLVDSINPLKEDKGITATAQVGKENTSETSKQLIRSNQQSQYTAENIGSVDNSTNFPWWALAMAFSVGILVRPIDFINDWRGINNGK
mgnify:CR=1 FL=1